jgi:hypothetical protein
MSTDHTWSARVIVFVPGEVLVEQGESVQAQLTVRIPDHFDGLPTEVNVTTVQQYFLDNLGLDVSVAWDAYDWLSLPEQRLCAMTAGAVFHDDLDLEKVRLRLAYYPRDVWLYLMLAGWWRVHPEMNLVGRAGYTGDELGSTLIASKIVSGLMHLSFLIERQYAPYMKWFGTAFSELQIADRLSAPLNSALHARSWREREKALGRSYEMIAGAFNDLEIAPRLTLEPVRLWGRPFTVRHAADLLRQAVVVHRHLVAARPPAGRERVGRLVPGAHQARPHGQVAGEQRRLGDLARALLGHPATDLAQRGRRDDGDRLAHRARAAQRRQARGPAPPVRRRRRDPVTERWRAAAPGARGDRRVFRLGGDAVRPVARTARE